MAQAMYFKAKCEIEQDIKHIQDVLDSGVFSKDSDINSPLYKFREALFAYMIKHLRDLLSKTKTFADHIVNFNDNVGAFKNVTELVIEIRNIECHPESDHVRIPGTSIYARFNICIGCDTIFDFDTQKSIPCAYPNDIAFLFGGHVIYLEHHIIRAFNEAKVVLEPLIK